MAHSIKTVYVIHHSHTDIGYTDLQERVIDTQVNYIKTVLSMMEQPGQRRLPMELRNPVLCGGVLEIRNGGGAGSLSQIGGGGRGKLACLPII